MKISTSAVFSLLASMAVARPHAMDEGDTLPEKSHVTAFVVSEDGTPSVECWEITHMINDQQTQRMDSSMGTARVVPLATSRELDGVDILTWPPFSPIWPPMGVDGQAERSSPFSDHNLFSMQNGLIYLNTNSQPGVKGEDDDDEDMSQHVFSLENGDDWFYFEDNYSSSSFARNVDAAPPPFEMSTISGGNTEAILFRFQNQPKHKVLHKGGCSFAGISTPDPSSRGKSSHAKTPLVKQYGHSAL